jgi:hypothetical protein
VRPNEFLRDGIIRNGPELIEEGTTLKIDIKAVSKAEFFFPLKSISVHTVWVFQAATAFLVASHDLSAYLLSETESEIAVFNLFLFRSKVLKGNLILSFHDNF